MSRVLQAMFLFICRIKEKKQSTTCILWWYSRLTRIEFHYSLVLEDLEGMKLEFTVAKDSHVNPYSFQVFLKIRIKPVEIICFFFFEVLWPNVMCRFFFFSFPNEFCELLWHVNAAIYGVGTVQLLLMTCVPHYVEQSANKAALCVKWPSCP